MEKIYNSKQIYDQLKKKQYEEYVKSQKKSYEDYIKRKKKYYMYIKKYYKEYIESKNRYYLDKKKSYERYIKNRKKYYIYKKKYAEEKYNKNINILDNKKNDVLESKLFDALKINIVDNNNVNEKNINDYSNFNFEELCNEEFLEKTYEEHLKNNIEDKEDEEVLEDREYEEHEQDEGGQDDKLENENSGINKEVYKEELLEKTYEESLEECVEDKEDEVIEKEVIEDDKLENSNSNFNNKELNNKKNLEEEYEKELGVKDDKFLVEDYKYTEKRDLSQQSEVYMGGLYGKFPVILAEVNLTIPVEGTILLNEEVIEIKRSRKNVFLTKSRIIPFLKDIDVNSGILFLEGFIKNNIEYEAKIKTTIEKNNSYSNIKYSIGEVPFNCTAKITFFRLPTFIENTTKELDVFTDKSQSGEVFKESVINCEPYEEEDVSTEVFNEKPFIELIKATFIKVDVSKRLGCEDDSTQRFTEIREKIILNLSLKVLQKQQVRVFIE